MYQVNGRIEMEFLELITMGPELEFAKPDWLVNSSLPVINLYRSLLLDESLNEGEFEFVSLDVMNSYDLMITLSWSKING